MGNDGGSIPKRRELVKEAARNPTASELKETQKEHLAHRWSTCPLSHKPLRRPVTSDSAGLVYNKDAVLQYLLPGEAATLNKDDCDQILQGRIKSLKDVVEVVFEADAETRWICPITSKQLGPAVKSVYIVPCGHAFSQEAIKEMSTDHCPQCNQSFEPNNVIPLFSSTAPEKELLQVRIQKLAERGLSHGLKKLNASSKKRKAKAVDKQESESTPTERGTSNSPAGEKTSTTTPAARSGTSTATPTAAPRGNGINNAATANLTARVLSEENERKKRRLVQGENENIKSLFTKKEGVGKDGVKKVGDGNFMTRGFSIPANAKYD